MLKAAYHDSRRDALRGSEPGDALSENGRFAAKASKA